MKMNFLEAVKAMKEGKKVKRKSWGNDSDYFTIENGMFCQHGTEKDYSNTNTIALYLEAFEATDWEIVEEKKTLSDKIGYLHDSENAFCYNKDGAFIQVKDVKEALKKLSIYIEKCNDNEEAVDMVIVREIFGDLLCP